jgi:hypothetical protein
MERKPEVVRLLRRFSVYLSFGKSNEDKVTDFLKKLDEHEEIEKTKTILRSDLIIFFLSKEFIESDDFQVDWKEKENKIFLIVLLENIEQISSLDLNGSIIFENYDSMDLKEIKMFQIFLSRLNDFKSIKSNQMVMMEKSELNSKRFRLRYSTRNFVQKLEFIGNDKVIVKSHEYKNKNKYEILIIYWIEGKIISKINIENVNNLDFCWIEHLNQLLVYQDCDKVKKFLLFTIAGDLVREVFSRNTIEHIVSAISYNKNKFEVYLNVFDKVSSRGSVLVLNDNFTQIKKISSNIINSDIPLNDLSEIEILNIQYNILHHNTNFAFIQEKNFINLDYCHDVYIFDKRSYSIVGVIKTDDRLIACYEGKLLFSSNGFYLIQNIPLPIFPDSLPFCKIKRFKEPNSLSSPYLLPCGYSACLDGIYSHYNIFKRIFICPMCKKEHKFKVSNSYLFNQNVCTKISDQRKSIIRNIGKILSYMICFHYLNLIYIFQDERWENFENFFDYNESEINIRIESLKEELNKKERQLINQVKKYELKLIRENSLNKEKLSIRASFKILRNDQSTDDDRHIKSHQIGTIYDLNLQNEIIDCTESENLEILIQKLCKNLKSYLF